MNIAILSDRLTNNGGTESFLLDLVNKYLHQGDKIIIYTIKVDQNLSILNHSNLKVIAQKLTLCPKKLRFPLYYNFLKRQLKDQSFDLILGINSPYCPSIGICCGTYLGDLKASSWERKINPLNYVRIYYEKKKYTNAGFMVAHSNSSKQELIDLYKIPAEKIKVIYPIPSLSRFKWKSKQSIDRIRKKYNLSQSKTYFLLTSTGHKRKGLKFIIQALKLLNDKNIIVLVAGSKKGDFKESVNVKYLGYVQEIQELYQACDATLLLSSYEPFGITVAESLMCGTPVIISKMVGAKDLIKPTLGTILENTTAPDLIAAMMRYTHESLVTIDKATVYSQIEPYINHHQMIKELIHTNDSYSEPVDAHSPLITH